MRGRKKDLEKENIEYETGPNLNAAGSGFFSMQPKKKKSLRENRCSSSENLSAVLVFSWITSKIMHDMFMTDPDVQEFFVN